MTKGDVNWYIVLGNSRIRGLNSPSVRMTKVGITVTRTWASPPTFAMSLITSRCVLGGFVGACHGRPQAWGALAHVINVRATSLVYVQLCATSGLPMIVQPLPARTRGKTR